MLDFQLVDRDRASNFNLSDIGHSESDSGEINSMKNGQKSW